MAADSNTEAVTRRQFLPFGQVRDSAPAWVGDRGYVGGTPDPATSLGAREYNPAAGRFLSADPLFTDSDPTQMGGYAYAGNDPVTGSDPTGLNSFWGDIGNALGNAAKDTWHGIKAGWNAVTNAASEAWNAATGFYEQGLSSLSGLWDMAKAAYNCFGNILQCGIQINDTVVNVVQHPGQAAKAVWHGLTDPIVNDWKSGHKAKAVGRAAESVVELFVGLKGLNKLSKLKELSSLERTTTAVDRAAGAKGLEGGAIGCAFNSFAGATPVLMADGTSKPIDQVKVGDKVQNAEPDSATVQQHTVTAIHVTDTDRDFVDLTIDTLAGPKTITTTVHHPVLGHHHPHLDQRRRPPHR